MQVTELDLSLAARCSLEAADIHDVQQLVGRRATELIERPEFRSGAELHEVVCELSRRGLTPLARHGGHVQTEREREMFRLRVVVGLSLDEIAERFNLSRGRVHQLLRLHFRLDGVPPAARVRRPPPTLRTTTLGQRRRLYLLAHIAVKRYYRSPLTLEAVAKALASSPRQVQRAYAQFGDGTFHDDLVGRRMEVAAELLSKPGIPVRDVARRVGYRQPAHFARAFGHRHGVSPSAFRAELCQPRESEALAQAA